MLPPSRRELMFQRFRAKATLRLPPLACYREMSDLPKPGQASPTGQQHQKPGEQSRPGLGTLSLGPPELTGKQMPKFAPTLCQPQVPWDSRNDTGALQVLAGAPLPVAFIGVENR